MTETFEAIIDKEGKIHSLKPIKLSAPQKVTVTITLLTNEKDKSMSATTNFISIQNLGWVVDDLEEGSREIAEMLNQSIERSGKRVQES